MNRLCRYATAALFLLLPACAEPAEEGAADDALETTPALEAPGAETDAAVGATLSVASLPDGGAYVTDASGRALYLLEGEPRNESTCYDECAEEWPPFLASGGTPSATAAGLQSDLLGTLERRDGATQVTYGGHALYYYHEDQGPGQTQGQDLTDQWGEWYLVTPAGEPLEEHGGEDG